jgi:hypothetical protein
MDKNFPRLRRLEFLDLLAQLAFTPFHTFALEQSLALFLKFNERCWILHALWVLAPSCIGGAEIILRGKLRES